MKTTNLTLSQLNDLIYERYYAYEANYFDLRTTRELAHIARVVADLATNKIDHNIALYIGDCVCDYYHSTRDSHREEYETTALEVYLIKSHDGVFDVSEAK